LAPRATCSWNTGVPDEATAMAITFQLPPELERSLRQTLGDLDQEAKESALIELYRQRKLTHCQLSEALGLSRFQADGLLKRHHVTEALQTPEDFEEELRRLELSRR
jgi:hypothetical protein